MEKKEMLQLTKAEFVGSAGGAAVLTALIVFLSSALV
ncbi:DUF3948 family protein [Bacillus manliponensis]|uniref:Fatty acid desaturase n=1 Tax=Bacillus manliponensis TaxID=574376 RepID=A0A073JUZ9_9BACI|nr:DUF3948 family protein [Bacillus manliponensis]KEK18057.1 fatty acid desaturase [Bacillus manliponensis]